MAKEKKYPKAIYNWPENERPRVRSPCSFSVKDFIDLFNRCIHINLNKNQ